MTNSVTADSRPRLHRRWVDGLIVLVLATAAGAASFAGSRGLDAPLIKSIHWDVWFDADCPRVHCTTVEERGVHLRTGAHPLFKLWTYPPALALRRLGLEPLVADRLLRSLTAAACAAAFYVLLRLLGSRRPDSVLFTLLAAVSAAAVFWFTVPTTYPAGLLSMLLALLLVAVGTARLKSPVWDVPVNILTLSFTSTNWMAGLLVTFARWPIRVALGVVVAAACFAATLMVIQNFCFPSTPIWSVSYDDWRYFFHAHAGGPGRILPAFFAHSMVMPALGTAVHDSTPVLSIQHAAPASTGLFGLLAVILWAALLVLGGVTLYRRRQPARFCAVLALLIAGQLLLHLLYGRETFLYACHFGPLLVLVAAYGTLGRTRRLSLALAVALLVCAGVNNVQQFRAARARVQAIDQGATPAGIAQPSGSMRVQSHCKHAARRGSAITAPTQQRELSAGFRVHHVARACNDITRRSA
jgi:hypothetical protein